MEQITLANLKSHVILDIGTFLTYYDANDNLMMEIIEIIIKYQTHDELLDFETDIIKSDEVLEKILQHNHIIRGEQMLDELILHNIKLKER